MRPYVITTIGELAPSSFLPSSLEEAKDRILAERFGLLVGLVAGALLGAMLSRRSSARNPCLFG